MAEQLVFNLPVRRALGRDDFMVSPSNALALAAVEAVEAGGAWPQGKLVLVGPRGAGKSHLAHVWAEATGARVIAASSLVAAEVAALASLGRVVVEDADRVASRAVLETVLLHLHNLLLAEGGRLLMTAASPPSRWGLRLPDLASRMQATTLALIEAPDDALLAAVLAKLFADRQLAVAPAVIPYLVGRMERSFEAAGRLVAALDARALAEARPITKPLAAQVLDRLAGVAS